MDAVQPPLHLRRDGHDDARIRFYNYRESALAFGMQRAEFNALASAAVGDLSPAGWLAAGRTVHRAAMDRWTRNEEARRIEWARQRRETEQSFRNEAERREKRLRGTKRAA
jgi:hypothetical protein